MIRILVLVFSASFSLFAQTATLKIGGDVPTMLTLGPAEMAKMHHETVTVTEHDGVKTSYEGIPLRELLQRAGAPFAKQLRGKVLASYLVARGKDGYRAVFTLPEIDAAFGNEPVLVADKRDGKALPDSQGPFRLIWPNDKVGARSVRMLESIDLVKLPQ